MATKDVAKVSETQNQIALATSFEDFQGAGFNETQTDDYQIPFLRILAQLSPQVNKREGAYVEGAEAGMLYNTVLNKVYDGEKGLECIPCHYNRRFVEWVAREKGGGYVGSYEPTDPIVKTTVKNDRGQDILPNGNMLTNTAQFFVILLDPDEGFTKAIITMSSTQLKKARRWNTQMQSLKERGKNGLFVLPMMSHIWKLTTVPESNDKGSWFGWNHTMVRKLDLANQDDQNLFEEGVSFGKSVLAGEVEGKEEAATGEIVENSDSAVM